MLAEAINVEAELRAALRAEVGEQGGCTLHLGLGAITARLTVAAKGQVTLKQELLRHLDVGLGQKLEADKIPDGRLVVRAATKRICG